MIFFRVSEYVPRRDMSVKGVQESVVRAFLDLWFFYKGNVVAYLVFHIAELLLAVDLKKLKAPLCGEFYIN
ncbi:hypothetical protein KY289_027353 [Solanum tuberosum]|nr:hypothetical protein KY289_027353 [Solanum tuberosum]